ncbi:MAG TPA: hypothetical protein VIK91_15885 [Nannocystis sp.]
MLRIAVVALALSVSTLGFAAAKPTTTQTSPTLNKTQQTLKSKLKIDPVWAKQLTPKLEKTVMQNLPKVEAAPNFAAIKRLDPVTKGVILQAQPEQVTGPIKYSARTPWIDDDHYLEVESNSAHAYLRMTGNYVYFVGPEEVFASVFTRPRVWLHFKAEPGRRYLLECLVDVAFTKPGNITARSANGPTYSVNGVDRASLLYLHTAGQTAEHVKVELAGDQPWYLDGCELSWTGP